METILIIGGGGGCDNSSSSSVLAMCRIVLLALVMVRPSVGGRSDSRRCWRLVSALDPVDGSAVSALDPVDGSTGATEQKSGTCVLCCFLSHCWWLENIFRLLVMMSSIVCSLFFCDHHGHMKDYTNS